MIRHPTDTTFDTLSQLSIDVDPQEIARKRAQRASRLNAVEIPLLRVFGMGLVVIGVLLHNLFTLPIFSWPSFLLITVILMGYALASWLVLYLFYTKVRLLDLGVFFLVVDVFMWTLAVYFSGGDKSWLFFILIIRAADQAHTSFKRAFSFAHLPVLSYALMLLYLSAVEHQLVVWPAEFTKMLYIYASSLYISLTARTAERRRNRTTAAIRLARTLIRQLQERSQELQEANSKVGRLSHQNELILHSAGEGICGIDMWGRVTFMNPAAENITGWKAEELIGQAWDTVLHHSKSDGTPYSGTGCPVRTTLQNGAVSQVDGEVFWRKDRSSFPVEYTSAPIREQDAVVGAVIVFHDSSERKLAEAARLRAEVAEAARAELEKEIAERKRIEDQLRFQAQLLDSVRESVVATDLEGGIIYWGRGAAALYGYRAEEVIGKNNSFIVEASEHKQEQQRMAHALATGSWSGKYLQRRKDGSRFWADTIIAVVTDQHGQPNGFIGIDRDITERKQTEDALQESEQRYRLLAENVTDVIWTADMNLQFTYISPSVTRLRGYTVEESRAQTLTERLTPASCEIAKQAFAEELTRENGEQKDLLRTRTLELELNRKDGSTVWTEVKMTFLRDQAGRPVGVLGVSRDITERKQAEAALLEAKEAAEAADRAKSEFLATMSHELRTPLSVIIGYTDLLLEEAFGRLTSEQSDPIQRVGRNARELHELIAAMLDLSRLEAGRLPVEYREIEVSELLQEVEGETQEIREQTNLTFTWHMEEPLPRLCTDPGKLKIVLKNLLGNAVKFTKEGEVTVDARSHHGGVEISVRDTGSGMSPEALTVIFEPFRQVDSSTMHGTGLGLHIVKRLLELLGGSITVESEVGRGSTFRVWMPTGQPTASEDAL